MLALIDRLHGLGLGVTLENYTAVDRAEAEFELASYLLHSNGRDAFGAEWASCPRTTRAYRPCRTPFWRGYRTDLGRALGPRTVRPDGCSSAASGAGWRWSTRPARRPVRARWTGCTAICDGTVRVFAALAGGQALVLTR